MRRVFILLLCLTLTTPLFAEKRPNILYIMSDDHAAHAIGAYGGRFEKLNPTPTIDKLAKEGILLENCFATNAICTPSRASILTGQYSHINGCKGFLEGLKPEQQTLPKLLKTGGYETAVIGKWHLVHEPADFDYYAVLAGQGNYFNPILLTRGEQAWPNNKVYVNDLDSVHSSDAITNYSIDWLKNRKDKEKPFFLCHQFKSPHDNFENAERYDFLYDDVIMPRPSSLTERSQHGPSGSSQYGTSVGKRNSRRNMGMHLFVDPKLSETDYIEQTYQRYMKKYFRTVKGVDDNIEELLEHLNSTGELANTIIIYTADQGFMLGEHDYIDKRWMYEESLRMPFIIRFPDKRMAGERRKEIVTNVDFAPTLLELAGVSTDAEKHGFQGRSFLPVIDGKAPSDWPKEMYYRYWLHMAHHDNPAHIGIRTDTEKLIFFYGLPLGVEGAEPTATAPYFEYYNLATDPQEMHNKINDPNAKENIATLKKRLSTLRTQLKDTDATFPDMLERMKNAGLSAE